MWLLNLIVRKLARKKVVKGNREYSPKIMTLTWNSRAFDLKIRKILSSNEVQNLHIS